MDDARRVSFGSRSGTEVRGALPTMLAPHSDRRPLGDHHCPAVGEIVDGRYVVERLIADGGMGRVYQCRHRVLGKKVALKVVRAGLPPEAGQRFVLEAKAASMIGNEHVVDVLDFGQMAGGSSYLVMEYLEGIPLSELLRNRQPLPLGRIVSVALQVADGLQSAHAAGILHRDIKPENVFLSRRNGADFVKIVDFGVAKLRALDAMGLGLTVHGMVVGTPEYMAPEQACGAAVDERCDIYALGVMLYELATGRRPFEAARSSEVLQQQMSDRVRHFESLPPGIRVPPELFAVISRCLEKRPDQRYRSMLELRSALEALEIDPPPLRRERRSAIPARRRALVAGSALAAFLAFASESERLGDDDDARVPTTAVAPPANPPPTAVAASDTVERETVERPESNRAGAGGSPLVAPPDDADSTRGARGRRKPRVPPPSRSELLTPHTEELLEPWPGR